MDGTTSAMAEGGPHDGLLSALADLIDLADRALESDRSTTRDYLARAAALVQWGRTGTPSSRVADAALAPWLVRRLTAYIDEHLAEPISTGDLTAIARMSTGHFFRSFKRSCGDAPFAFIARRRVWKAQQLMLTTNQPLCEIALAVGLCDQSHMTRLFRKWVGESPSAWRRRMIGRVNLQHDRST
jgi:AraC-like DNA-binding protein